MKKPTIIKSVKSIASAQNWFAEMRKGDEKPSYLRLCSFAVCEDRQGNEVNTGLIAAPCGKVYAVCEIQGYEKIVYLSHEKQAEKELV